MQLTKLNIYRLRIGLVETVKQILHYRKFHIYFALFLNDNILRFP